MKRLIAFFFVIYSLSLLPGLGWGDIAKYQLESTTGGLPLNAGMHPWYHVVSNCFQVIFPFGSVALKANILSLILGCVALGFFYKACLRLGLQVVSATFGTLLLGLSHTFWSVSVVAESYPLFACLWILALSKLLIFFQTKEKKELQWGLFILGFAIGNNLIQPFAAPAILISTCLYFPESRNIKYWGKPILFGFLGMLPWLLRILYAWLVQDFSPQALRTQALDTTYEEFLFWNNSLMTIFWGLLKTMAFCAYQFGICLFFLIRAKDRKGPHNLFLPILIFSVMLFCSTYLPQRSPWLMLAAYIPLAFWITISFDGCMRGRTEKFCSLIYLPFFAPLLYLLLPWLLVQLDMRAIEIEKMAGRDDNESFYRPWKTTETSAKEFVNLVDEVMKPGDTIVVDFTPYAALKYAQEVEGRLKGIVIVSNIVELEALLKARKWHGNLYLGRKNRAVREILDRHLNVKLSVIKEHLYLVTPIIRH